MLNLYNSLTCKIEPFQPAEDKNVKMYTCGPSTYQQPHIGNYRTFLYEDILQRYLEYLGYNVKRLITLTDVEDKAIMQAKKENLSVEQLTEKNEAVFFEDFKLLRIKTPDFSIRASSAVDQAAKLIVDLTDKGYAYWYTYRGSRNSYFDPLKFGGFGKLAHLDMSKWPKKKRRFHKDTYPGTPWNMGDFILWHGCRLEDVCYNTPIGSGRPAWNIQDAAIVTKHFGFSIDIACGGIDNLVRHHDYTLAIAESLSEKQFSRFWLHGGHLLVDGEKMSKSLGNVYFPSDVVAKGFAGEQLRFFLIYGPYREQQNFTWAALKETSQKLDAFKTMLKNLQKFADSDADVQGKSEVTAVFDEHMNNNLDVKAAFDSLYDSMKKILEKQEKTKANELVRDLPRVDSVLQCLF